MTGPQTTAAEIAKIAEMITHDHQSLSVDSGTACLLAPGFVRRSFGMVHRLVLGVATNLAQCGGYAMTRNATAAIKMAPARNTSRLMMAAFFAICSG